MREPGRTAIGTWSGGRFLRFGETIDEERLEALLRPGDGIDTVLTADTYGQGEADSLLGRALAGVPRDDYSLVGAVGHDFYEGERDGPRGFPRFTDPRLRAPGDYAGYLRMAAERSLERLGVSSFDLLLLHNPDRIGYSSETVWDGMVLGEIVFISSGRSSTPMCLGVIHTSRPCRGAVRPPCPGAHRGWNHRSTEPVVA